MGGRVLILTLTGVLIFCAVAQAQVAGFSLNGHGGALTPHNQMTQGEKSGPDNLKQSDMNPYGIAEPIVALLGTLVFFGIFAIGYVYVRGLPSEKELHKQRKKKKL
ncbi:MAG: hypothetical protein GC154_07750 [bacterium]|nr:hypothetical protein [bacterium]